MSDDDGDGFFRHRLQFYTACSNGDLAAVQALFAMGNMMGHMCASTLSAGLLHACQGGHLRTAQFIRRRRPRYVIGTEFLYEACLAGQTHVVQWLAEECASNDAGVWVRAFLVACQSSNLALVKWLHATHPVDIHCKQDEAFHTASCHVARWLLAQDPDYDWDPASLARLKTWTHARHAWMRAVASG